MNKAWQLGVVDRTLADFSKAPSFQREVKRDTVTSPLKDGTVVFVVNTIVRSFLSLPSKFTELRTISGYTIPNGVTFANVWNPSKKIYGQIMRDFLRPILSEQDAIKVETKFGISLEEFI